MRPIAGERESVPRTRDRSFLKRQQAKPVHERVRGRTGAYSTGGDSAVVEFRTAPAVIARLWNSEQHMSRGRGSTGIDRIPYSNGLLIRGQLKRTQANRYAGVHAATPADGGVALAVATRGRGLWGLRSLTYMPHHQLAWSQLWTMIWGPSNGVVYIQTGTGGSDGGATAPDDSRGSTQVGVWTHAAVSSDSNRRAGRNPSRCGGAHPECCAGEAGRAQGGSGGGETGRARGRGCCRGFWASAGGYPMNCLRQILAQAWSER